MNGSKAIHLPGPFPKIFRLTSGGKLIEGVFKAATINTPSMLCVEDALDGLTWAESIGGLKTLIARSVNLSVLSRWVENSKNVDFLATDPATISSTSVCIKIVAPWFLGLDDDTQAKAAKYIGALLNDEGIAYDVDAYRDAPLGFGSGQVRQLKHPISKRLPQSPMARLGH